MLLRWLVSNYLRQAAEKKLHEAAADVQAGRSPLGASAQAPGEREDLPPCDIAVLFALGIESGGLRDAASDTVTTRCHTFTEHAGVLDGRNLVIAETGVGAEAAEQATADILRVHRPRWVISAGFAGALEEELRRGNILMADTLLSLAGDELAVGLKMDPETIASTKGLHVGRLLTVDKLVRTPEERRRLAEQYRAAACDMETFGVARACQGAKTPLVSVRVITDAVDDELPRELESMLKQSSLAGKLGAAAGAIFNRPSTVKDMWRLREDALKASDRLAKFLRGVLPQLPLEEEQGGETN